MEQEQGMQVFMEFEATEKEIGDLKTKLSNIQGVNTVTPITKEEAYFLEINLRNDGTCYITTQAGVNMPVLWVYSCLGKDASKLSRVFKRQYTYGMNEINYLKYTFSIKRLVQCIKEFVSVKAFSLIKWNDMKPVIYKVFNR